MMANKKLGPDLLHLKENFQKDSVLGTRRMMTAAYNRDLTSIMHVYASVFRLRTQRAFLHLPAFAGMFLFSLLHFR